MSDGVAPGAVAVVTLAVGEVRMARELCDVDHVYLIRGKRWARCTSVWQVSLTALVFVDGPAFELLAAPVEAGEVRPCG